MVIFCIKNTRQNYARQIFVLYLDVLCKPSFTFRLLLLGAPFRSAGDRKTISVIQKRKPEVDRWGHLSPKQKQARVTTRTLRNARALPLLGIITGTFPMFQLLSTQEGGIYKIVGGPRSRGRQGSTVFLSRVPGFLGWLNLHVNVPIC